MLLIIIGILMISYTIKQSGGMRELMMPVPLYGGIICIIIGLFLALK